MAQCVQVGRPRGVSQRMIEVLIDDLISIDKENPRWGIIGHLRVFRDMIFIGPMLQRHEPPFGSVGSRFDSGLAPDLFAHLKCSHNDVIKEGFQRKWKVVCNEVGV